MKYLHEILFTNRGPEEIAEENEECAPVRMTGKEIVELIMLATI
jgi:hypothetical protein